MDLLNQQKIFLESKGFTVDTAESMEEGLEKVEAFGPDLILADLMMEHFDSGFVFCKKVKERENGSNVPIIMQTGAAKEMGFTFDLSGKTNKDWIKVDEVLTKPIPLEELVGKIQQYLKREK
jgi:CheY-like chemotaxis protein